ncbi:MAG TPA: hypothetical protein VFP71_01100 [Candidatus Angelobacter sp.]|nr:hypothetical protein [Candidatus Angelobacter sp.]
MASTGTMKKPVASQRLELLRSVPLNKWVALSADETRIVAIGNTFMEADEAAKKTGEEGYFLTKTPDSWLPRAMRTIEI